MTNDNFNSRSVQVAVLNQKIDRLKGELAPVVSRLEKTSPAYAAFSRAATSARKQIDAGAPGLARLEGLYQRLWAAEDATSNLIAQSAGDKFAQAQELITLQTQLRQLS